MNENILTSMELRDYFAAQAMSAYIIASHKAMGNEWPSDDEFAEWAYDVADSMMEYRIPQDPPSS